MPNVESVVRKAVSVFGSEATTKLASGTGEPEAQLRTPLDHLLSSVAEEGLDLRLVLNDEDLLSDVSAKPDWSVLVDGLVTGHIELKSPGKGADTSVYTGHDAEQWERLSALPNILYTDGNQWALYRSGELIGSIGEVEGDVRTSGDRLVPAGPRIAEILADFLLWVPIQPRTSKALATICANLCRLLRLEVLEALDADTQPLRNLADDWRELLFPEATDEMFADGYAQTVTFALLLARAEGIDFEGKSISGIATELGASNSLMGKALDVLTDPALFEKLATSLSTLHRLIAVVEWSEMEKRSGPATEGEWLYFYEYFLSVYDPELRKQTGSYYTPNEVVHAMVLLSDDLLRAKLDRPLGFANENVVTIDPAVGTGTYLLHVIDLVAAVVAVEEGVGAVPGRLEELSTRLIGFEKQTGPHAVAELRILEALSRHKARPGVKGTRLYVTDTLDNPFVEERHIPAVYGPIAASRKAANEVKASERVIVVIGNPPYREQVKGQGSWVETGQLEATDLPIFHDFIPPADLRVPGNHLRHLRNLYVYFWRWATWKVFEHHDPETDGIVAFITSSAWLRSPGFVGMRAHLRSLCNEIFVVDLGGGNRGGRRTENVFAIQTPVAIVIGYRSREREEREPARIFSSSLVKGTTSEKLERLAEVEGLESLEWTEVVGDAGSPFLPVGKAEWARHPLVDYLVPWGVTGVVTNRTWVHAPDPSVLTQRWDRLVEESDIDQRKILFKESYHRPIDKVLARPLPGFPMHEGTVEYESGACPPPVRFAFRSFDRQWLIPDIRLIHGPSPNLWAVRSERQVYMTYKHNDPISSGPGVTFSAYVPDVDHYHGRGGRASPLWRDATREVPNLLPGLCEFLATFLGFDPLPEHIMGYIAGVAGTRLYSERFYEELAESGIRIPLTKDGELFEALAEAGRRIIWLHTFGDRFVGPKLDEWAGPPRTADPRRPRVLASFPIPGRPAPSEIKWEPDDATPGVGILHVGEGRIYPVSEEVWEYNLSGMRVVEHWFGYRRRNPAGRRQSPLDDINSPDWPASYTTELLDLLNVLDLMVEEEQELVGLLDDLMESEVVTMEEMTGAGVLPVPPEASRAPTPPKGRQDEGLFEDPK